MEILGTNIPDLQNEIASGVESVRAGITESIKVSGAEALGIAHESFSIEQVPESTYTEGPALTGDSEYRPPGQYFQKFGGLQTDSAFSMADIARTLADPDFSAPLSLENWIDGMPRDTGQFLTDLSAPFLGQDRSIIVVGGKMDPASDRGIIVVGGKTPETFFHTIDDSLNALRDTPDQELEMVRLQNMLSRLNQAMTLTQDLVEMQRSATSALFRNLRA